MKLDNVIPWGRNFAEYQAMFDLTATDLNKSILGCGDGPASFNAEMFQQGHQMISVDPVYQFSAAQIRQRVEAVYETVISQVAEQSERFVWKNFANADELGRARLQAMETFLLDYDTGKSEGRYQAQSLPELDFMDGKFELCLCSHFLFLYADKLSLEFHLASVKELLRVASEVKIFPLLNLAGDRSPHVAPVIEELQQQNFQVRIETVGYEFQKGGNEMLVVQS